MRAVLLAESGPAGTGRRWDGRGGNAAYMCDAIRHASRRPSIHAGHAPATCPITRIGTMPVRRWRRDCPYAASCISPSRSAKSAARRTFAGFSRPVAAAGTAFASRIGERERIALYRVRFIEGWLGFRSRFGYAHISGDVWSESCRLR